MERQRSPEKYEEDFDREDVGPVLSPNDLAAREFLERTGNPQPDSPLSLYDTEQGRNAAEQIQVTTEESSISTLYLAELMLGHRDSDPHFLFGVIDRIQTLPEEMKPDVVVVSGLVAGDFRHTQKPRRGALLPGLSNMNAQFAAAKQTIDKIKELGIPVIYNMGDDDQRVAEDNTVELLQRVSKASRPRKGEEEGFISYYNIDALKRDPRYQEYLDFQLSVVIPYCLRSGRDLRKAGEFAGNEQLEVDEVFMLFDAWQDLQNGVQPNPETAKLLELDNLFNDDGLIISGDVDIHTKTAGKRYTELVRHSLTYTPTTMPVGHMRNPIEMMNGLASSGVGAPNKITTLHNHELVGVGQTGNRWVVSAGSCLDPTNAQNSDGRHVSGDISWRLNSTRGRAPKPSAVTMETTDDGRTIFTIFNDHQMKKSDSLEDRMAVALNQDFQEGSPTAKADLQVKWMDMVHGLTDEGPLAIYWNGDILHGRNYPDMPNEGQGVGLISMDSQERFAYEMISQSLESLSPDQFAEIIRVGVEPGNHEANSGTTKWHGHSFSSYLIHLYERALAENGFSKEERKKIIKMGDTVITPSGESFRSFTGIDYYGDNGVMVQHYPLERGAKGNMGGLPVYQALAQSAGVGKLSESIDYQLFGHWHHPQFLLHGMGKLAIIGGSMADTSGYEWMRGYSPVINGTILRFGGGLPTQIEFVSAEALIKHRIKSGPYSDAALKERGYKTDRGFDPGKHSIVLPRQYPKNALQKYLLDMTDDARRCVDSTSVIR